MGVIEFIVEIFMAYPILVSYLGGLIVAEEGIIVLGVMSGQGVFDWWIVLLFGFLGLTTIDIVWFWSGRVRQLAHLKRIKFVYNNYLRAVNFMHQYSKGNDFFLILTSKFVYGTRIAVLMYMGRRKLSFYKFFLYNTFINFWFVCLAVLVGWGTGKGMSLFINAYNGFIVTVTVFVFVILIYYIIRRIIGQKNVKRG
jgi:membrane protein DedA with SNARE-associated domain